MSEVWEPLPRIARELDISDSTARRWVQEFESFFESRGHGAGRRFHPRAREVLKRIQALFETGNRSEVVAEVLQREFRQIIDVDVPEPGPMVPDPKAVAAVPALIAFMKQQETLLEETQRQVDNLSDQLAAAEARATRREERRDEALLSIARELQAIRAWQKLPWYRRLFRRSRDGAENQIDPNS